MTTHGSSQAPRPEPRLALLVTCVECGAGVEAPLPIEQRSIALLLAQHAWFMSVLSPPGQGPEVPIVFGALCASCAPKIYPPEVLKASEEARQALLRSAQGQGA